jgi:hypothetical protein
MYTLDTRKHPYSRLAIMGSPVGIGGRTPGSGGRYGYCEIRISYISNGDNEVVLTFEWPGRSDIMTFIRRASQKDRVRSQSLPAPPGPENSRPNREYKL